MKILRNGFFFILLFLLTSCSFFQRQDQQYLTASSTPPLKIPPGLSSNAFQQKYPVSNKDYSAQAKQVSIVPPG